jgi:hypothetical protein
METTTRDTREQIDSSSGCSEDESIRASWRTMRCAHELFTAHFSAADF